MIILSVFPQAIAFLGGIPTTIGILAGLFGLIVIFGFMAPYYKIHMPRKRARKGILITIFMFFLVIFNGAFIFAGIQYLFVTPSARSNFIWDTGPFLTWTDNTATSITITWITKDPTQTQMQYSTIPEEPEAWITKIGQSSTKMHRITLNNLFPNTTYYYSLTNFEHNRRIFNFTTAPLAGAQNPFRFLVFGDSQNGGGMSTGVFANFTESALQSGPYQFSIHVGDLIDQGNDLRSWKYTMDLVSRLSTNAPFQSCVGNHDLGSNFNNDPEPHKNYPDQGANWLYFFDYPYVTAGNPYTPFQNRYYSFTYDNAYFLAIDSEQIGNFDAKSSQAKWIEEELRKASENSNIDWIFCYLHRPVFSQYEGAGSAFRYFTEKGNHYEWLCPLFDKYGVDAVFQGHVHDYQAYNWSLTPEVPFYNPTLHPWVENADPLTDHSTLYFVTGGTANNYNFDEIYPPNSPYMLGGQLADHYMDVQVNGTTCIISAWTINNTLLLGNQSFILTK
jgi:hypothetical protein